MKTLFEMDDKNYNPNGNKFVRNSARAIIYRDGKLLLMHSKKYDYYKFPGGGIEAGEDSVTALVREVREESGYNVIVESIEEYGHVLRRQKDSLNPDGIFEQDNFYFFCSVNDEISETDQDDYEKEEEFEPVWIEAMNASKHNLYETDHSCVDEVMLERDSEVMDMADLEIRKRERIRKEYDFIIGLGNPEYIKMLEFVKSRLESSDSESGKSKSDIHYSRFEHTKRVLAWTLRLYEMSSVKNLLHYEDLIIAAIFHDVGRGAAEKGVSHAHAGVPITREYLTSHGFSNERTEFICSLVASHSDKHLMKEAETEPNLLLLMEADLMDDMGALGIVMDCMIVTGRDSLAGFSDCYDHIARYTERIQQDNPMVTPEARKIWDEKTGLVDSFMKALYSDIHLG